MENKKSIFEYSDYRKFLSDTYEESKARNKNFSYRFFAKQAGFSSSNFLMLVMKGQRNLSEAGIEKFAKGLKLSREEASFFRSLVLFGQAKTAEEKQLHAQEMLRHKRYKEIHPLSEAQFNYYAHWYFSAVRALVGLDGFREDPAWIAEHLRPKITVEQAKKALEELQLLELVRRDDKGELHLNEEHITSGDEVSYSSIAHFHREMMKRASESIDIISRDKRDISGMTLGMSEETAKKVKALIQRFRNELVEVVSKDEEPNTVYQVNFQLFPLAEIISKEGEK